MTTFLLPTSSPASVEKEQKEVNMPRKAKRKMTDIYLQNLIRVLITALFDAVQSFLKMDEILERFHDIREGFARIHTDYTSHAVSATLDHAEFSSMIAKELRRTWSAVEDAACDLRRYHGIALEAAGRSSINEALSYVQGKTVNLCQVWDIRCWNYMVIVLTKAKFDAESLERLKLQYTESYLRSLNSDQLENLAHSLDIPTGIQLGTVQQKEETEHRAVRILSGLIISHQSSRLKAATLYEAKK